MQQLDILQNTYIKTGSLFTYFKRSFIFFQLHSKKKTMKRFEVDNVHLFSDPDLLMSLESFTDGKKSELINNVRIFIVDIQNESNFRDELKFNDIDDFSSVELI